MNDQEPPEHARFATYLNALNTVHPAEESGLVRRILTDPDLTMARSAVLRHLDERAAALHLTPAYLSWASTMIQTISGHPFLTHRLQEWTLLRDISLNHPWDHSTLAEASDWLHRRLTETSNIPASAYEFLAEHGRTRRIRNAAAAKARKCQDGRHDDDRR
ncbi:hypothetical protein OG562_15930 [Streptomyces sp. NBC_01275]|uniref:hypothetical protein n=1 Tax=Streptomyces sp. NBC_01275 TaxID=2903807 RepID=UPI0022565B8D|nr:hypothetical protein [Streptomyces sp. NBC_01275]MCX4762439.1 hypothetical protein [Streptomyces sp. NBC_01275]